MVVFTYTAHVLQSIEEGARKAILVHLGALCSPCNGRLLMQSCDTWPICFGPVVAHERGVREFSTTLLDPKIQITSKKATTNEKNGVLATLSVKRISEKHHSTHR